MKRVSRFVFQGTVVACALSASLAFGSPFSARSNAPELGAQESAPLRYVRAKESGAKLYNLADKNSLMLGSAQAGSLLAVYAEQAGYLSVESPASVEVWVFGQYVRALPNQSGLVEITGGSVNMRPIPKSDTSSYPLDVKLHKGERVRVVGRDDPKKPLAEDWLRIVAPPGTRTWVSAGDTTNVDPKEDVRAAWSDAVKAAQASVVAYDVLGGGATLEKDDGSKPVKAQDATSPKSEVEDGPFASAERAYETARSTPNANWASVRAEFQSFLEQNPKSPVADQARLRLQQIALHEEIAAIKAESGSRDAQRDERLRAAQRRLKESGLSQDPMWGRFQARGIVRRDPLLPGQAPHYIVWWGGQPSAEIVCSSGRYDLSVFDQFEIGVQGVVLRTPVGATSSRSAVPGRIDVSRIEVIAGSGRARN